MATVSSHVLNAVSGRSAIGVRVECVQLASNGERIPTFIVETDEEGRISVPVEIARDTAEPEYELIFYTGDYFDAIPYPSEKHRVMSSVVVRISMVERQARYHVPVIVGPHSYTVWWSA